MTRIILIILALAGAAAIAWYALTPKFDDEPATNWPGYEAAQFDALQADGEPIVVDVYAPWCPTCRSQEPILEGFRTDPKFEGVNFVRVDYDNDAQFLETHAIPRQSTVLVFKDGKEVARSVAETDPAKLEALVSQAL
ncbi:thioredoxin family protein [Paraurantiacibacter namhicola]|uniref:Thioredoxin n=1 Tax=Paraurantiacibacter namhicola TaxID=645517 RepID=A0A1C7D4U7_9SPHN|nr:thioredoxin family protein [Paraurantiacibacter namhicola]ANU06484.1 Thioredoxin [Paraurantiacibacter namhicola]